MREFYHVLVLGGGVIGKACALRLAQQGLRVALVALEKPIVDRVYTLSRGAQAFLSAVHVWQAMPQSSLQPVCAMEIFTDNTRPPALRFSSHTAVAEQLAWTVPNRALEQSLDAALRGECGGNPCTRFTKRARVLCRGSDGVHLTLEHGESLRAECVIGADGLHSWTAAQVGLASEEKSYARTAIVAEFKAERRHDGVARQWFIRGEILALLPLPEQQISIVWSTGDAQAQNLLALSPERLASYLQQLVWAHTGALQSVSPARAYPLCWKRAPRLATQGVALVGDAAHVIHPLAGQGVNLGLRDVAALAQVFAAKEDFRSYGDQRLLDRYARARALDIELMAQLTDGLYHLFLPQHAFLAQLRRLGLGLVERLPGVKQFLLHMASA
jgi:2-polyprenylphenol 6-hydroxylase